MADARVDPGLRMHAERTPNPNSLKWVLGEPIAPAGTVASFESRPGVEVSPLVSELFAVHGVSEVFLTPGFITVSKLDGTEWLDIAQPIVDAIRTHIASGEPALGPGFAPPATPSGDAMAAQIRRVIDEEIRPAVARDGGDIVFVGYREGTVELQMKGACSGCPSATTTLGSAVEGRLKAAIPQIERVVAV